MMTVIPWWTKTGPLWYPVPREGPLEEDEASSLTAWAQGYREVRKNLRDSVTGRGYYKPESSRHKKVVRKTMFEKKPPRRDRNIRTPFRDKARDHSTERVTGAELRKRTRCYRCRQLGHMARECQNPAPKDIPQSSAKNFFFTGAQQPVVGAPAALRWCDRLLKRHGLVPVDVTPSNMIATCGGIGTAKVVQVLDFPARIVGVNGVMRFLVLEEPMSVDGRQQFIPPLTLITTMRQLGANIRMKDSGDVLEIEDDQGTTNTEKMVRERSGHVHNQLDFFSREGWKLPDSLRAQLKFDPFMASNRHEKCSYGKYELKDEKQVKLVPTAECYGLDALETVKTSTVETSRDDEIPEDLWPNLSAMVTKLQQLYIGSHEEKLSAREHGFVPDFWAGSPSDRTSKLYRVHVKPRSSMLDPRLCATSPIPVGVEILSRKTYLQETRSRRVAQLEHNINDDKNLWSGVVEGFKWIGVSAFHLSIVVTPLQAKAVKLEQATPNSLFSRSAGHGTCPGVIFRAEPGKSLKLLRYTGIGTNTRGRKHC